MQMAGCNDKDKCCGRTVNDKIDDVLLQRRRVFLSDAVDQNTANDIIKKLWFLEHMDDKKPVLLIINSPGGSVDSGFAIWDQIKMLTCPVYTLISGLAASFGSLLSLAAGKGKRFATANSRIMIHQPLISGVIQGQATDLEIQAEEMLKTREMIVDIYADATNKTKAEIAKAIDRDNWMTAQEALSFGLLDKVIDKYSEMPL
jgi:ATP-dependent Clp protease, protease subunit